MRRESISRSTATLAIALTLGSFLSTSEARKIKTKHSIPKLPVVSEEICIDDSIPMISMKTDSIRFCDSIAPAIRFYGFDKTVTSNQESFFITNGLDYTITALEICITYTDMKGRQLHRRDVKVECEVPPHETKRTDIRSWDTQKSFYYYKSVKPKRQATPFEVRLELLSITKARND